MVGATWIINQKLRQSVTDHEQRIAQLEQRPRFTSRTLAVAGIATTANSNRSIWTIEGPGKISFAQIYVEAFGPQTVNQSVVLTPAADARKSVVIQRIDTSTCTLTFWLENNEIMLAPAVCTAGMPEDRATIEAAVEVK